MCRLIHFFGEAISTIGSTTVPSAVVPAAIRVFPSLSTTTHFLQVMVSKLASSVGFVAPTSTPAVQIPASTKMAMR